MAQPAIAGSSLIRLRDALEAGRSTVLRQHVVHLNPRMINVYEFIGLDNVPVRAEGSFFWDDKGRRYVDFLSAFGTLLFGHNPPRLCDALRQALEGQLPNLVEGPSRLAGALAENLSALAPGRLSRVFFANSGTEAVDAAIKMARAATGRPGIVACRKAYHGRSIGALSVTDRHEYRENFEPLLPDVEWVNFGDVEALTSALGTRQVAGVIMEPLQGEAGMIVPPAGYLRAVRQLCSRHGTVLVFDEIQSGMGRTGKLFACEHDGVDPDCLLLGKALGGGVMPLSALLTRDDLWHAARGDAPQSPFHVSTYAGNSGACAVGLACLELLLDEGVIEQSAASGSYLVERLRNLQSRQPLIADVRGRGLMIGIQLSPPRLFSYAGGGALVRQLQNSDARYLATGLVLRHLIKDHQLVTAITLNNPDVIRVQPPLNVDRGTIDLFVDGLDAALQSVGNYAKSVFTSAPAIMRFFRSKSVAAAYE